MVSIFVGKCVCFFRTTFMLRVSFSSAPECVDRLCWNHPFSTPPRAQGHGYCSCYFFQYYLFLFNKGLFSENRFSLHNDILNIPHLPFFPTTFMFWVSFSSAPECVDRHCWTAPFSSPPRAHAHGYCRCYRCCRFFFKLPFLF